jgi:uncharacterized damage-inducible protein DinB
MKNLLFFLGLCLPIGVFAQPSVQQETLGFLSYNEGRVLALAEKFTEDQYSWRPDEGVRSVSEVLMHIASGNYFFMSSSGVGAPAGVNAQTMEKEITDKAGCIAALKASYIHLKGGIDGFADDQLGDSVTLPFPGEHTKMTIVLLSLDHTSEHLGQLIAYARMNGVTPPWSEDADK